MEEKLNEIFLECKNELENIGISFKDVGNIDIKFSKRNNKRYGCCKQENPDKSTMYKKNRRIYYQKFNMHHIEISKWVMELNIDIIKNTIIHELIHCLPNCNNHGKEFKKYAKIVNDTLGYNISRLGNKKEDYEKSKIEFTEEKYKYKIKCTECDMIYYRQRLQRNFFRKYRCGKCRSKLELIND